MLDSPRAGIVGCRDLDAATDFFAAVGFQPHAESELAAEVAQALYGVAAARCRLLQSPATQAGAVLLVAAPDLPQPPAGGGLSQGGYAVDVYTRDRAATLEALAPWGAEEGQVATYPLGPGQQMSELVVEGPDGCRLVVIDTTARRPSVLDTTSLVHSEASAYVLVTAEVEAETDFWRAGGLDLLRDDVLRFPEVAEMLGLPSPDTPLRLTLLWRPDRPSTRLELLSLPEGPAPDPCGDRRLRCGLSGVLFDVDDLGAAQASLADARWEGTAQVDDAVHGSAELLAATSPGGTPFLLRASR